MLISVLRQAQRISAAKTPIHHIICGFLKNANGIYIPFSKNSYFLRKGSWQESFKKMGHCIFESSIRRISDASLGEVTRKHNGMDIQRILLSTHIAEIEGINTVTDNGINAQKLQLDMVTPPTAPMNVKGKAKESKGSKKEALKTSSDNKTEERSLQDSTNTKKPKKRKANNKITTKGAAATKELPNEPKQVSECLEREAVIDTTHDHQPSNLNDDITKAVDDLIKWLQINLNISDFKNVARLFDARGSRVKRKFKGCISVEQLLQKKAECVKSSFDAFMNDLDPSSVARAMPKTSPEEIEKRIIQLAEAKRFQTHFAEYKETEPAVQGNQDIKKKRITINLNKRKATQMPITHQERNEAARLSEALSMLPELSKDMFMAQISNMKNPNKTHFSMNCFVSLQKLYFGPEIITEAQNFFGSQCIPVKCNPESLEKELQTNVWMWKEATKKLRAIITPLRRHMIWLGHVREGSTNIEGIMQEAQKGNNQLLALPQNFLGHEKRTTTTTFIIRGHTQQDWEEEKKVFICPLPPDINADDIKQNLQKCGDIEEIIMYESPRKIIDHKETVKLKPPLKKKGKKKPPKEHLPRDSPAYALLLFKDQKGAEEACELALKVFGIVIKKENAGPEGGFFLCRTRPAKESTTLRLLMDTSQQKTAQEIREQLISTFAEHQVSALVQLPKESEVVPEVVRLECKSFAAAFETFRLIEQSWSFNREKNEGIDWEFVHHL